LASNEARNPYHLSLPAWIIAGVRCSAERVGSAGSAAPDWRFAALSGWSCRENAVLSEMPARWLPLTMPARQLFA
jgi:hypothetical protein